MRPAKLLIAHNLRSQEEPNLDIGEPGQTTPHDHLAQWGVLRPGEIATQSGDPDEIG
jgi:hypothetical protein